MQNTCTCACIWRSFDACHELLDSAASLWHDCRLCLIGIPLSLDMVLKLPQTSMYTYIHVKAHSNIFQRHLVVNTFQNVGVRSGKLALRHENKVHGAYPRHAELSLREGIQVSSFLTADIQLSLATSSLQIQHFFNRCLQQKRLALALLALGPFQENLSMDANHRTKHQMTAVWVSLFFSICYYV